MLYQTNARYFGEVLAESKCRPVLLDFYAGWCVPCRALAPELDAVSERLSEQIAAYSVDTDTEPALAERYGIDKLPAVLLLQNETVTARWEGNVTAAAIEAHLELIETEKAGR